ncbi:hypothetical protein DSO57_1017617 [Entomophthora muscae]|uniref:Uncharacterized protein n=1 Tax=Entomophthora muscae TaxID=34485 RepID=A0ACC2S6T9_9FUNG|nr:hypothetical protein DSO57_1017617 [Entomophthora muscae]
MDNPRAPIPTLFHPLAFAFLLSYLGSYFLLGRSNPLLGRYRLLGEIFRMGTVSIPIGTLVTGLNPSTAIHLLEGGLLTIQEVQPTQLGAELGYFGTFLTQAAHQRSGPSQGTTQTGPKAQHPSIQKAVHPSLHQLYPAWKHG